LSTTNPTWTDPAQHFRGISLRNPLNRRLGGANGCFGGGAQASLCFCREPDQDSSAVQPVTRWLC
jgi:hypothetical protein